MFILWVKSAFHLFLICIPFNFYFCLLFSIICVALKIKFLANFIYPHVRGCNHWNKSFGSLSFKPRQPQSSGKNKWRGQQLQINYWSFYLDATLQTGLANAFFFLLLELFQLSALQATFAFFLNFFYSLPDIFWSGLSHQLFILGKAHALSWRVSVPTWFLKFSNKAYSSCGEKMEHFLEKK